MIIKLEYNFVYWSSIEAALTDARLPFAKVPGSSECLVSASKKQIHAAFMGRVAGEGYKLTARRHKTKIKSAWVKKSQKISADALTGLKNIQHNWRPQSIALTWPRNSVILRRYKIKGNFHYALLDGSQSKDYLKYATESKFLLIEPKK